MRKDEMLNVILRKFLSELAALDQNAVTVVSVSITLKREYFPRNGNIELFTKNGITKAIHEQEGRIPFRHRLTCYEH
ncbi:hypothetical protein [Chitinophaga sp. sic0106]|uniref:hypothetical protein n=1 Tax=Chitinophaga sp. sic0106 TaxID=2854785 RepID=UPI001C48AB99|nr:hypothetical protein [Chitinophaga sp. sic0106]MBV7532373.1 hypothetical protein [Chitinophaga sp. sic0106]